MKVDRTVVGRPRFVLSCVLGLAVVLAGVTAFGVGTASSAATGSGREKLPGHQGLVPPGATLVGPAPTIDDPAAHRHAQTTRSRRVGGRGASGLRSEVSGVPPLPDADGVRAGVRADARHRCAGHIEPPTAGPDSGGSLGDRIVASSLGHRGPGPIGLLDADFEIPPCLGKDRVRQHDGTRGLLVGGTGDRRHPRTRHPQPPTALDERSGGEPGHGSARCRRGDAGPGPGAARADRVQLHQLHQLRRGQHRSARRPRLGPGVRVRSALLLERLRRRQHHRAGRNVGSGIPDQRHQPLRLLLRHHTRPVRSPRCPSDQGLGTPGPARPRPSSTSRLCSPWPPKPTLRSTKAEPRTAFTTSSARSSTTTPPRSSVPAGRTAARLTSARHSRTPRTRFSRPPPPRGSRRSSPPATRVRKGATSTARSMPPRAPIRSRRRSTLRRELSISLTN